MALSRWLFCVLLLYWAPVCGQHADRDTVFISKYVTDSQYSAVYILKKGGSRYDRQFGNSIFRFSQDDSESYAASILPFYKDSSHRLKKFKIGNHLPRHWCTLSAYKGGYYLYAPCDWGTLDRFMITDSTLVNFFMDGPYAYIIDSFSKEDKNTFVFNVRCEFRTITQFRLHIIDWKRQIAILDNGSGEPAYRYTLIVGAEKARAFPIIVNDCKMVKQLEIDLDIPDFVKILQGEIQVK